MPRLCDVDMLVSRAGNDAVHALQPITISLYTLGGDLGGAIIDNDLPQNLRSTRLDSIPPQLIALRNQVVLEAPKAVLNRLIEIKAARRQRQAILVQVYVPRTQLMHPGIVKRNVRLPFCLVVLYPGWKVATQQVVSNLPCCCPLCRLPEVAGLGLQHSSTTAAAAPMRVFVIEAVTAVLHLNTEVVQRGQKLYVQLPDGSEKQLCCSMEGHKFALACTCGKGHVRYSTLNSVRKENSLMCQYCQHGSTAWREAHKRRVCPSERKAMQALKDEGLDTRVACEVSLPFWHGRMDFYDIPSKTAMQADGGRRGAKRHSHLPGKQLHLDLECCVSAWKDGVRLLRLHSKNANWGVAMTAAVNLPYDRFVMLTSEYAAVHYASGGISCIDWLHSKLEGAQYLVHAATNCHIFYPAPTL